MKRFLSILLLISIMLSVCVQFSGCSSFVGGREGFANEGKFYNNVGNVIYSIFAGGNSYIPLINNKPLKLEATATISDYIVNDKLIEDGSAKLNLALLLTNNLDYDLKYSLKGFGDKIDIEKRQAQVDKKMYIDYGYLLNNKPLCYYDEGFNCFTYALYELKKEIDEATFVDSTAEYKLKDVKFDTDTIEFSLNSEKLIAWAEDISANLYSVINSQYGDYGEKANLVYGEWHYSMENIVYYITENKIHLSWKRYYDDGELCRETIKLHNPNNNNITFDIAYAADDDKEFVEISAKAYNGSLNFDVFALSAEKSNNDNGFSTSAKILIGDELLITASNKGNDKKASGGAKFSFMDKIGERVFEIDYNYSGSREGSNKDNGLGLKQTITFNAEEAYDFINENYLSFDLNLELYGYLSDEKPEVLSVDDYYDLSARSEISIYNYVGEEAIDGAIDAFSKYLKGVDPGYSKPLPYGENFSLDIDFDDGKQYETDGSLGKKYVDILQSDTYTYEYSYVSNEPGYPLNYSYEYKKGDKKAYKYDYTTGVDYEEYHDGYTIYEVRHDIEKIIYSTYDKQNYEINYSAPVYVYFQSGYCTLEEEKYAYEKYYDYSNNKYTFLFNENNDLYMTIIERAMDGEVMYIYVKNISSEVEDAVFEMSDYEQVDVVDFFK